MCAGKGKRDTTLYMYVYHSCYYQSLYIYIYIYGQRGYMLKTMDIYGSLTRKANNACFHILEKDPNAISKLEHQM